MRYLIILFLFAACNPVKQVLRDPAKVQDVVDAYLLKYPIVSDTVTKVDTVPGEVIYMPGTVTRDTTYVKGDTVKGRTITRTIRDTIIKKEYYRITKTITDNKFQTDLQRKNVAQSITIDQYKKEVKELKIWRVVVIALFILAFILAVLYFLKRFKVIR